MTDYSLMALVGNGIWVDALLKSNNVSLTSSADTLSDELTFDSILDLVEGTHIILKINSVIAFTGITTRKEDKKLTYTYNAYDYGFYLNKNETIIQFNKVTADVAIKQLCTKYGIKCNCVKISYIVEDSTTTTISNTASVTGNTVIAEAKKFLGVPYLYGGTTPKGFDCSGFVQYVFKQLGVSLTRTTYTQVKEGTVVAEKSLEAGDIVFFGVSASLPEHEGIYMGDGNVIEAPHTGTVIKIVPLKSFGNYVTSRRIKVKTTSKSSSVKLASQGTYAGGYANGLYKAPINTYAPQYGFNPNLIAGFIEVESTFNPSAGKGTSHVGLGQFDETSAKEVGLINSSGDHRLEAIPSIIAICKLLLIKYKATGTMKGMIMTYGENSTSYYNKVVAATPGHNIGTITSGKTGTVTATQTVADTTITTMINKIYKDMTLSAIIDDILANATLSLGTKYIHEMISDILYVRVQAEYKIFPTFILNTDLVVNSDIQDMVNTVVATSSDDTSTKVLTTVSDPVNIKIYGGLEQVLTIEAADVPKAKTLANNALKLGNKVAHDSELNIVVISGAEEIRSNRFMGLVIASKGLNGWYNIKSCNNVLLNGQCKSSITIEW